MIKLWDLNIWFKEYIEDDDVLLDKVITINPALYIADDDSAYGAVRKVYTGILYRCDANETAKIRAFRSEEEYGTDWFDFWDELYGLEISKGIQEFLSDLPDPYSIYIDDVDDLYHIDSISKLHNLVG